MCSKGTGSNLLGQEAHGSVTTASMLLHTMCLCVDHAEQNCLSGVQQAHLRSRSVWVDDNAQEVIVRALDGDAVTWLQSVLPHVSACNPTTKTPDKSSLLIQSFMKISLKSFLGSQLETTGPSQTSNGLCLFDKMATWAEVD